MSKAPLSSRGSGGPDSGLLVRLGSPDTSITCIPRATYRVAEGSEKDPRIVVGRVEAIVALVLRSMTWPVSELVL